MAEAAGFFRPNSGTAWWLVENGLDAPGPYDDPEIRPLAERCLLGFGSTSGPPMLPVLYNNLKRIVQTDDHVMILVEMVHDARVVRMDDEHAPPEIRKWLGDSVGHWEGDTLVVDTTNFTDTPALSGASRNLHVVERFTRIDADTLRYQFTVDDPTVWSAPVERRVCLAGHPRPGLRVRLPRGELLVPRHPGRRTDSGAGRPRGAPAVRNRNRWRLSCAIEPVRWP